jgi:hypothetical protein
VVRLTPPEEPAVHLIVRQIEPAASLSMKKTEVPTFDELMGATVEALKRPEGTAPIDELVPEIVRLLDLPEEVAEVPHGTSGRTELEYRSAWARTYLCKAGLLENSRSKLNPLGVKGAGESGIVAVGGAVANAVACALEPFDVEITVLPLSVDNLSSAIRRARRKH